MLRSLEGFGNTKIPEESVIDWDAVPRIWKDILARAVLKKIYAFYEDPENVKDFEEWKKRRNNESI